MILNKVAKEGLTEVTLRKSARRKETSKEIRVAGERRGAVRLLRAESRLGQALQTRKVLAFTLGEGTL